MTEQFGAVRFSASDRLNRRRFSERLALMVDRAKLGAEGYVIGIEGAWGSGKTSVINMMAEHLLHLEIERHSHHTNFYHDSGRVLTCDRLAELAPIEAKIPDYPITVDYEYFTLDVVKRGLCRQGAESEDADEIYRYFRLKKIVQERPRNLVVRFEPWLVPKGAELASTFIRDVALSIGGRLGRDVEVALKGYVKAVQELAPIAGAVANSLVPGAGTVVNTLAGLVASPSPETRTLDERKSALEAALSHLHGRKVVIIVDDLDRLLPKEAVQMISLIKGLGRLPNVIYVLGYDEKNLAKLIGSAAKVDGVEYLEKIVQYKRPLPLLRENALSILIDFYFDQAMPPIEGSALQRLQEAWVDVISREVKTPRDAVRLGDSFLNGWLEVGDYLDASDFVLLQLALQKYPGLHGWISHNLRTLCGLDMSLSGDSLKDILSQNDYSSASREGRILSSLFPKVAEKLRTYTATSGGDARLERRLHVFDYRSAYFDLVPPEDGITKSVVKELVTTSEPLALLHSVLDMSSTESASERRKSILDDLRYYFGGDQPIGADIAEALIAISPQLLSLRDLDSSFFGADNAQRLSSILFRGLDATRPSERAELLHRLIDTSVDVSVVTQVVRTSLGPGISGERRPDRGLDLDGHEPEVREHMLGRIRAIAEEGQFFKQANPRVLAWFWRDADPAGVKQFLTDSLEDLDNFPDVVRIVSGEINSTSRGRYLTVPPASDELVPLALLDRIASELSSSSDDRLREAAQTYLTARAERGNDDD